MSNDNVAIQSTVFFQQLLQLHRDSINDDGCSLWRFCVARNL